MGTYRKKKPKEDEDEKGKEYFYEIQPEISRLRHGIYLKLSPKSVFTTSVEINICPPVRLCFPVNRAETDQN